MYIILPLIFSDIFIKCCVKEKVMSVGKETGICGIEFIRGF